MGILRTNVNRLIQFANVLAMFHATATISAGTEFTVEFDCFRDSPACQQQSSFTNRFRSAHLNEVRWGSAWSPQRPHGAEMTNDSGGVVMAVRVRAINGDTFAENINAGGQLFTEVWRKADGTEMIFNDAFGGAGIPVGEVVWNRVYPRTPTNPYENLRGNISRTKFDVPKDGTWVQLRDPSPESLKSDRRLAWTTLDTDVPRHFPAIDVYGESDDGRSVLFISNKTIFFYDAPNRKLFEVYPDVPVPIGLNRITSQDGRFTVWYNGTPEVELDPENMAKQEVNTGRSFDGPSGDSRH
jgi:hypothetical protein